MSTRRPANVFKLVVTGPFSAGKTTFIETVVQRDFVTMAAGTSSQEESGVKRSTTVGMDFGALTLEDDDGDIELRVYGTPGQDRFSFMWDVLAEGADAYVLLLDGSSPDTWQACRAHHETMSGHGIPGVLAINRSGVGVARQVAETFADLGLPVLECDARDADEVAEVLVTALVAVLELLEADEGGDDAPPPVPAAALDRGSES